MRENESDLSLDEFGCDLAEPLSVSLAPAIVDNDIAALAPPSSRSRWRNASVHSLCAGAASEPSYPMTGTRERSARVAEGHVTAALLSSMMNSRRVMPNLGVSPASLPQIVSDGT